MIILLSGESKCSVAWESFNLPGKTVDGNKNAQWELTGFMSCMSSGNFILNRIMFNLCSNFLMPLSWKQNSWRNKIKRERPPINYIYETWSLIRERSFASWTQLRLATSWPFLNPCLIYLPRANSSDEVARASASEVSRERPNGETNRPGKNPWKELIES